MHSQPVEPTGEGRPEISPLLDSVRVSEAGSELVEASKGGRRRSRCHASCISSRWRPDWEIAECSVCIIEQSGFERVFHVQSLFDALCPAHFEGSIQNGTLHCIEGDIGWSPRGANDQRVEVVHASAKDDVVPPTRRVNFQTEVGGKSAIVTARAMEVVVGSESSE